MEKGEELINKLKIELTEEIMEKVVKPVILQTREETLRAVLPESFGNRSLLDVTPLSDNGGDDCRRTIQQKAKELGGIDLTNN